MLANDVLDGIVGATRCASGPTRRTIARVNSPAGGETAPQGFTGRTDPSGIGWLGTERRGHTFVSLLGVR